MNMRLWFSLACRLALGMLVAMPGIEARAATGSQGQATVATRALPAQARLVYDVRAGKDGFKLGQAIYTWQVNGDRYHLESVAEAQGLASMLMSGRITQTSEGRVGGQGLVPDQFAETKKEQRKGSARFDWVNKQLFMSRGTEPLAQGTQDLLSFSFHLALTVLEGMDAWRMPVTNGRKLKNYQFKVMGRERVLIGRTEVVAVHVRGSRSGDESLDVWLAPERGWLPVRIRTQDDKGVPMEMKLGS